jgi:hypothetical protein
VGPTAQLNNSFNALLASFPRNRFAQHGEGFLAFDDPALQRLAGEQGRFGRCFRRWTFWFATTPQPLAV